MGRRENGGMESGIPRRRRHKFGVTFRWRIGTHDDGDRRFRHYGAIMPAARIFFIMVSSIFFSVYRRMLRRARIASTISIHLPKNNSPQRIRGGLVIPPGFWSKTLRAGAHNFSLDARQEHSGMTGNNDITLTA